MEQKAEKNSKAYLGLPMDADKGVYFVSTGFFSIRLYADVNVAVHFHLEQQCLSN